MKLNPDLVRDILLAVEDATDGTTYFCYEKNNNVPEKLKKYDHNEIYYHIRQCSMADLIIGFQPYDAGDYITIGDLSPDGHEFLANIRNNNIWKKVKDIGVAIGTPSLGALTEIATNLATQLIAGYFQLK